MARKSKPFHIFASTLQFSKGPTLETAWEPKPELGPSRWARAAHVSASWCRAGDGTGWACGWALQPENGLQYKADLGQFYHFSEPVSLSVKVGLTRVTISGHCGENVCQYHTPCLLSKWSSWAHFSHSRTLPYSIYIYDG